MAREPQKTANKARPEAAEIAVLAKSLLNEGELSKEQAAAVQALINTANNLAQLTAVAQPAASPDLVSELNNIDFGKMIGGPLNAAIQAQTASALATVNFIKEVGFITNEDTGKQELVMVDFTHTIKDVNADGTPKVTEKFIRIPFLAMLPIPSIRIETVDIDFNCKLNSVETSQVSDKLGVNMEVGGGFGPIKFKVSASYQRQSSFGSKVQREYAMNVKVKASQDEMPAGLEKILNMLAS